MPLVRKPGSPADPSPPSLGDVLRRLGGADPEERWAAARAAAGLPESAAALAAALALESDAGVREAMFTSLARIGSRESIAGLLPMLRCNDAALRTGALDALRCSASASRDLLAQLLADPDPDVRILSCELARNLPGAVATPSLCGVLARDPEVNVCAAAVEVLAEVGDESALAALEECARRFPDVSFLCFAVKLAQDQISAADPRA